MTSSMVDELKDVQSALKKIIDSFSDKSVSQKVEAVRNSAENVGDSWSGSWFGYHSRVYYQNLEQPPAGAHFSSEWGLRETYSEGTSGDWVEYKFDSVKDEIYKQAGSPGLTRAKELSKSSREQIEEITSQIVSILETGLSRHQDAFLKAILDKVKPQKTILAAEYIEIVRPKGRFMSRDALAMSQGIQAPPHIVVLAEIYEIESPGLVAKELLKLTKQAADHIERAVHVKGKNLQVGTKVFIGHGRSLLWKNLKDFVNDRLSLPWDEFNRVPVAGITNIARLSEMLDSAAVAFVIMTAEDEQVDGKMRARENVVHEVGLFQGRLGFTKAIVLLEDGCGEFSNITGLGQIRFPKGNISACFEEIRLVLEREGVVAPKV